MARIYVTSTPASRGEPGAEAESVVELAQATLTLEDVENAAAELGFRLVPVESEGVESEDGDEPPGNASREAWAEYAVSQGASEDDLKDADGEPLGRDELRAKYGTPAS